MDEIEHVHTQPRGRMSHAFKFVSLLAVYVIESGIDAAHLYARIIAREKEIFLGAALTLIGALNFNSARYCDGNTADYLSCTRPATYYYFDAFDTTLIVLGVFFILIWCLKRRG